MLQYKEVTSLAEWQQVLQKSNERPALVFKHSTTCPISARAFREFQAYLSGTPNSNTDYVMVKVIESRPVSNQVANDLHVRHQSPQAILVQNKAAVWDTSHGSITETRLKQVLNHG